MKHSRDLPRAVAGHLTTAVLSLTLSAAVAAGPADQSSASGQQVQSNQSAPVQSKAVNDTRIRIGPGDLLAVSVFDVPELAQEARVSDEGDAVLTLIGSLHLAGMTTAEAQTLVEDRLQKGNYILNPHVSIIIREYGTQGVSVLGQVKNPGVYQVLGKRNLLDVISQAGGITEIAAQQATIKRRSGDVTLQVSLSNTPGELLASNVELQPGDTVIVPRAGIVYVLGDVGRPGGFIPRDSGQVTLLQAIALAAGVNHTATEARTRIIHKTDSGPQETTVNLKRVLEGKAPDIPLSADDIVYVPSSRAKRMLEQAPPTLEQSAVSAAVFVGIAK